MGIFVGYCRSEDIYGSIPQMIEMEEVLAGKLRKWQFAAVAGQLDGHIGEVDWDLDVSSSPVRVSTHVSGCQLDLTIQPIEEDVVMGGSGVGWLVTAAQFLRPQTPPPPANPMNEGFESFWEEWGILPNT